MPFRLLLSWQEIRRHLLFICLAIAASVVPMTLLALLNDAFPAVAGGMIGLLIKVRLVRRRDGLVDDQVPYVPSLISFVLIPILSL